MSWKSWHLSLKWFWQTYFTREISFFQLILVTPISNSIEIRQRSALLIRKKQDSRVCLYKDGAIRHIPDPETLILLGYSFGEVIDVNEREFYAYREKAEIESVKTAPLVEVAEKPGETWMVFDNQTKRQVPDIYTLAFLQRLNPERSVKTVPEDVLQKWETGTSLVSIGGLFRR